MRVLKFSLGGKNAFFKKPDVNAFVYFTYGCVHKIAIIGIFGAILGYKGYSQMKKGDDYPEFYDKLNDLKIAIVPGNKDGFINKKIQVFNNSVGYASQEAGGNLIVKEQWLEDPLWDIYVKIDNDKAELITDSIMHNKSIYIPYLGKNDHIANIFHKSVIDNVVISNNINKINSLCPKELVNYEMIDEEDDEFEEYFKYEEKLPILLDKATNNYIFSNFVFSNISVKNVKADVYNIEGKNIVFF